jgi:hypothetical protein
MDLERWRWWWQTYILTPGVEGSSRLNCEKTSQRDYQPPE